MKKNIKPTRREFLARTGAMVAGSMLSGGSALSAYVMAPSSRHPLLDSVDVLVVGGGPAGIGAALGAARAGANTLLIENHAFFGGTAAWALAWV